MKKITLFGTVLATAGLCAVLLWKTKPGNTETKNNVSALVAPGEENEQEPNDAALQWEIDMMKDPATGKIPLGIRQQEIDLKLQLRAEQAMNHSPESNTYAFVGPGNMGGRTRSIVYDKRDDNIVLAGGVSGGVFRSTDGGTTWTRVSPMNEPADATCIVQDPRPGNEDRWYYSTGHGGRGNSASYDGGMFEENAYYLGSGIYMSLDNGVNWVKVTGVNETGQLEGFDKHMDLITRIAVHPTTGDVYVAASGAIYRGHLNFNWVVGWWWSWTKVLGNGVINYYTMTDVAITSGGTIYAGISGLVTGGFDGVWKSTTGDLNSWTRIAGNGSPSGWDLEGQYGRIVLAIPPSNQNQLWVAYYNSEIKNEPPPNVKLFRYSYNPITGIAGWSNKSSLVPSFTECYTGYALSLAVKPDNSSHIYLGTRDFARIIDGANPVTEPLNLPHSDIQWIGFKPTLANKPNNKDTIVFGCDGGVYRAFMPTATPAGSLSWISMNKGYPTFQYYFSSISQNAASTIQYVGGAQDNGTTVYKTTSTPYDHLTMTGGDGFQCFVDNNFTYTSSQQGELNRVNSNGGVSNIDPAGATYDDFRTYFHMNPVQSDLLFYADGNTLFRTTTASTASSGAGWTEMTNCTFEYYPKDLPAPDVITAMATTGQANATLFIGTMHGTLARLTNSETAASNAFPTILTPITNGAISDISVDPSNNNNVMFTVSSYYSVSVYYSTNALAASPTWTNVEGNLTLPSFRSCIIVNGPTGKEYYVGTSIGLFRTTLLNGASTVWTQESPGLIGDAVINSLTYRPSDYKLLIGTHGNGMYAATLGGGARIDGSNQPAAASALTVFPNPLSRGQSLTLNCSSDYVRKEALEVFDITGKMVSTEDLVLQKGANTFSRSFDLPPGVYVIRLGRQATQLVIRE